MSSRTITRLSQPLLLLSLVLAAQPPAARAQCARNDANCPCPLPPYSCRLDGSDLCTAVIGITSTPVAVSNVVRVRNKFRVNTPFTQDAKILFSSRFTFNPADPSPFDRGYSLDIFYDRLPGINVQFTQSDYYVPNTGGAGRIGLMSSNPTVFPVSSYPIDCGPAPQVAARSQVDISGKDLTMDFVKGGTFTQPLSGWDACTTTACTQSCGSCAFTCTADHDLPAGTYQIWNGSMSFDGVAYPVSYALPGGSPVDPRLWGVYVDPSRLFNFRTEFFESGTFVQFLIWDMQVQTEGSSTWVPVTQFQQGEPSGSTYSSAGARINVYENRPVLEISNDGSNTYHNLNDVFSIPADVSQVPSPEPRIEFTDILNWVYNDESSLTLVAKLDHTSASPVTVALRITGTPGATSYINNNFSNLTTLTVPAGSLTGSATFPLGGTFPSGSDVATIYMSRSCNGMIGTVPAEKITFVNLPRRPHVTQKYDFGVQGPFTNYDVFATVNTAPSQDFSPLMQYNFEAGVGGKIGLRLTGGQKFADFIAADLSAGATSSPITGSCQRFGATGTGGTSCSVTYNWVTGREYRLRLTPLLADNRDWRATVLDMDTAAETEIGRIHLTDASPYTGFGALLDDSKRPNGFLDWFSSSNTCGTFAATSVTWRGPYASDGHYNPTRAEVVYGGGSCPESNGSATTCPVFRADLGGSTTRTVTEGTDVWAAAPCSASSLTNDDFGGAKAITALPYGDEVNTAAATTAADDPVTSGSSCGTSVHSASVWYRYTAATSQQVRVSGVGSDYDTILAVWQGTRGQLTQVGCNHQSTINTANKSELDFSATAGTTYYIELAGYQAAGGGVGSVRVFPTPQGCQ